MRGRKPQIKTVDGVTYKECHWCNEFKTLENFYPHKRYTDGRQPYCRECFTFYYKKRNTREKNRDATLAKYDLTKESYQELYNKQEGKCAVCKQFFELLHVDHDHETGRVRGLLCVPCNNALGLFKDNMELLQAAFSYLMNHFLESLATNELAREHSRIKEGIGSTT